MRTAVDALVKALEAAPPKGLSRRFDDRRAETHATIYHPVALSALRWLYALPQEDSGEDPWFMTVDQPPPK